jgi:AcrR family transcriptional regulator
MSKHPAIRKPKRGRPVGNHDDKRAELVAAARSLIAREGYHGASIRSLAHEARCSTGTVTHYFGSKDEIVALVLESLFAEIDDALTKLMALENVLDSVEQLLQETLAISRGSWSVWTQLFSNTASDRALTTLIRDKYARFRAKLATLVERGQALGQIRNDFPPDLIADQICALADGWVIMMPIDPGQYEDNARGLKLVKLAVSMLRPSMPFTMEGRKRGLATVRRRQRG